MHVAIVHIQLSENAEFYLREGINPLEMAPRSAHEETAEGETKRREMHGVIAYCNIIFDNIFIIDEVKLIRGQDGFHISMPSRKTTRRSGCGHNNYHDSVYCAKCGRKITLEPIAQGLPKHADICHPIAAWFRRELTDAVIRATQELIDSIRTPPDSAHPPPA